MRVLEVCRVGSWVALSVVFSGLWLGNPAVGEAGTRPTGLIAGDQYRLVFVTSTVHNAVSDDIGTYNTIVDALGDTHILASDWRVIGSTETVDAITNTATPISTPGISIWRLDDVKVADDYQDLWDGTLDAPIAIDEFESAITKPLAWTGTGSDGYALTNDFLGGGVPGFVFGTGLGLGQTSQANSKWVESAGSNAGSSNNRALYAISGVLTVPEPSSAILLGVGVGVGWIRFRRKRRQASSTV